MMMTTTQGCQNISHPQRSNAGVERVVKVVTTVISFSFCRCENRRFIVIDIYRNPRSVRARAQ